MRSHRPTRMFMSFHSFPFFGMGGVKFWHLTNWLGVWRLEVWDQFGISLAGDIHWFYSPFSPLYFYPGAPKAYTGSTARTWTYRFEAWRFPVGFFFCFPTNWGLEEDKAPMSSDVISGWFQFFIGRCSKSIQIEILLGWVAQYAQWLNHEPDL